MARYEHLPIYRAAFDLAVHIEKLVRGFTRYHKYSLGSELREQSREILARIIDANQSRDRAARLLQRPRSAPWPGSARPPRNPRHRWRRCADG